MALDKDEPPLLPDLVSRGGEGATCCCFTGLGSGVAAVAAALVIHERPYDQTAEVQLSRCGCNCGMEGGGGGEGLGAEASANPAGVSGDVDSACGGGDGGAAPGSAAGRTTDNEATKS